MILIINGYCEMNMQVNIWHLHVAFLGKRLVGLMDSSPKRHFSVVPAAVWLISEDISTK